MAGWTTLRVAHASTHRPSAAHKLHRAPLPCRVSVVNFHTERRGTWVGLVPRQYSSGGKQRLYGISKRGDTYLRTMLIHGARAVLRFAGKKSDTQSKWIRDLIERRGYNRAAVAMANKNARIIQALLSSDELYRPPLAMA